MSLREPFEPFASRYVVLPGENIDTDQIIPARFLTTIDRDGLGALAFHDWRYDGAGKPVSGFPLNDPGAAGVRILVAGRNFGCGSSREHAVWALQGFGFKAVISSGFADIFRANAIGNGLLPIQVEPDILRNLMTLHGTGRAVIQVDLAASRIVLPDGRTAAFPMAPFPRHCLLHGIDEMDYLLEAEGEISTYEAANPPRVCTILREVADAGAPGGTT